VAASGDGATASSVLTRLRRTVARSVNAVADRLSPALRAGGEVRFSTITRDRIAGRLTLGDFGLYFDSQVVDGRRPRATVRALDQRELVDLRADQQGIEVRFGGGTAISRTSRTDLAARNAPSVQRQSAAAAPARVFAVQGNAQFVDEFFRSRDFALLPELSYALGLAGATGARYRPSLALHSLGLTAAGVLGVDPARPGVSYRYRLPPQLRRPNIRGLFDRIGPTECWSGPDEGPNLEGLPACPGPGCEAYPNRENDCFGMCGPGCSTCWTWVCGDCCYHDFCADHDALLRQCDGVEDVAACLASVIVIPTWLLGCDHGWLPF
jgi:hypothetical protein